MSSYLSSEYKISQPQESVNTQLVGNVLKSLNDKYTYNKSIVDQTLAKYKSLRGLREQDNQYIASKIKEAESAMDNYGQNNGNLAFSSVKDTMLSALSNVYEDPFIKNAVMQKAKVDQYDMQVDETRKGKNGDKYNSANYQYGKYKAGVNDYLAGKTDTIGNLEYIEYVDKSKVALDVVKQLKDLRGKQVIETVDPYDPTKKIKKTIDGLTADEIFRYMPGLLPNTVDRQMEVDAWTKYGGNEKQADADFDNYSRMKLDRVNGNVATLGKSIKNKSLSEELQKENQTSYDNAVIEQTNTIENLNQLKNANPLQKATYLERNSWQANIANSAQAKESVETENNENYFAKADLELKVEANERAKEKLDLDKQKLGLEIQKTQSELNEKLGTSGEGSIQPNVVMSTRRGELTEELKPHTDQENQYGEIVKGMKNNILETANGDGIPKDVKEDYVSQLASKGYDKDGVVIKGKEELASKTTPSDALYSAYTKSNMSKYDSDNASRIHESKIKRDLLGKDVIDTSSNAMKANWDKNKDLYINDLKIYSRDKTLYGRGGVSIKDGFQDTDRAKQISKYLNMDFKDFTNMAENQRTNLIQKTLSSNIDGAIKPQDKYRELVKLSNLVPSFKDHIQTTSNATKKTQINKGTNPYFTTENLATLPAGSADAKYIIDRLPNDQKSDLFNNKASLSFYKTPEGSIKFIQNSGLGESEKRGVFSKAPKEISIGKEDDLYASALKLIDIDTSRQATNASKTKQPITSIKDNQTFLSTKNTTLIAEGMKAVAKLPQGIFNGVSPSLYLNKTETGEELQRKFGSVVAKEKLQQLTNTLATNMRSVNLKMISTQNQWSIDLQLSNGYQVSEDRTEMQTVDPNFNNVFQEYPQVLITHAIVNELSQIKDQDELKNKVDYYINNFK